MVKESQWPSRLRWMEGGAMGVWRLGASLCQCHMLPLAVWRVVQLTASWRLMVTRPARPVLATARREAMAVSAAAMETCL